jgi:hypothetical protein
VQREILQIMGILLSWIGHGAKLTSGDRTRMCGNNDDLVAVRDQLALSELLGE